MATTVTNYGYGFTIKREFPSPTKDALRAAIAAGQPVYAVQRRSRTHINHLVIARENEWGFEVVRALCGKAVREWHQPKASVLPFAEVCSACRAASPLPTAE